MIKRYEVRFYLDEYCSLGSKPHLKVVVEFFAEAPIHKQNTTQKRLFRFMVNAIKPINKHRPEINFNHSLYNDVLYFYGEYYPVCEWFDENLHDQMGFMNFCFDKERQWCQKWQEFRLLHVVYEPITKIEELL